MSDRLKVRPNECGVVVKMTGQAPNFTFVGWIDAEDAKKEAWKSDPGARGRPAYFVPDGDLIRPELLEVRDGGWRTQKGGAA